MAEKPVSSGLRVITSSLLIGAAGLLPGVSAADTVIEISGQLNRALMFADDGANSKGFFVDNSNSNSRFRFKGSRDLRDGLEAGFLLEAAYSSNPSSSVNFSASSISPSLDERHIDVYLKGGWGQLSLGQGNGAANGGMEEDLSGTTVLSYSGMSDIGGGISYVGAGGAGPEIGDTHDNLDFESRYDRLRYDTPKLSGMMLSFSAGDKGGNEVYELALRPEVTLNSGKLAAALGFSTEKRGGATGSEQTIGGSVSYAMKSGLNATLAIGSRSNDAPGSDDKKYIYLKVGYKTGLHAVSFDFGVASDFDAGGDDATAFGLAWVYQAAKWMDLYAGAKIHSLDRPGANFDDVTIITAGTRLKF